MTNFPFSIDDDTTLPLVNNNLTEVGGEAINALRDAMFAVEEEVGISGSGTVGSIANRIGISLNPDGTIKPSAIASLGLVYLPITDIQIGAAAGIQESKLTLTHSTQSLFNLIQILENSIDIINQFINLTGIKVNPHINGTDFRHTLSHIDVNQPTLPTLQFINRNGVLRNNTDLQALLQDINQDLFLHENADGEAIITNPPDTSSAPPVNYAHNASGIHLNTSSYSAIPLTTNSVQQLADFLDDNILPNRSIFQNTNANGISRTSRLSSLTNDGKGQAIVPLTTCTTYLLHNGSSVPVDDITTGDDVILFTPDSSVSSSFIFDSQFAQVKNGDLITVNYGTVETQFFVESTKKLVNGTNRVYAVRINGKNLFASTTATARIDRSLSNDAKWGVLSSSIVNNDFNQYPSAIVANPRSAVCLGLGFDPAQINRTHYNLYLQFYPNGNPNEKVISLPAIDITGNQGTTPGKYTLNSVIEATNRGFRTAGYNYRLHAFAYGGEFGLMLTDPYQGASFSVIAGITDGYGNYTSTSNNGFANNVIDNFNSLDPLGLGANGSNAASPPYAVSYDSAEDAFTPTKIFTPLRRAFYYVDGVEQDTLKNEVLTSIDAFGDGYWTATITARNVLSNRIQTTYTVDLDLCSSGLKVGKTLVVQPSLLLGDSNYKDQDYGRFIIENIQFNNCDTSSPTTLITVYDAVTGTGISPYLTSTDAVVHLYFNSDSVEVDAGNIADSISLTPYKRHFEVLVENNGHTQSHERARFLNNLNELGKINFVKVSPKLKGYKIGINQNQIRLTITSYDTITGIYSGYLSKNDGTRQGIIATGKKGEVIRFYDESGIDFIDFEFELNDAINSFSNLFIDIDLFGSLSLDETLMLVSTFQVNDSNKQITYLRDQRTFGNVSEKNLTNSALDYIAAVPKTVIENGVVKGFELYSNTTLTNTGIIDLAGGQALINGKIISLNDTRTEIPVVVETLYPTFTTNVNTINWFLCVNEKAEYEWVASTDYDPDTMSATYGSLDHTRLFYVENPNSSSNVYVIRGTYLNNLVINFRDLTPLYYVSATVALSGSTYIVSNATITDMRRYLSPGFGSLTDPFVLSSNGFFRTFASINLWLQQLINLKSAAANNTNLGATVKLKDHIAITSATSLSYKSRVIFEGDGISSFDLSNMTTLTIINNCVFNNCVFNFNSNSNVLAATTGSNVYFNNNIFNFNTGVSSNNINLSGILFNNIFNYLSASTNNINLSGTISAVKNKFNLGVAGNTQLVNILDATNGIVNENIFNRNSNTITSYINGPSSYTSGSVYVIDNIFDSSTINGTNQNLIANLPQQWIYEKNVNTPLITNVKILSGGSPYTILLTDSVLLLNLSASMTINLPSIANSPKGRTITIKDVTGNFATNNVTLVRANGSETIENVAANFVYSANFGSITLISNGTTGWSIIFGERPQRDIANLATNAYKSATFDFPGGTSVLTEADLAVPNVKIGDSIWIETYIGEFGSNTGGAASQIRIVQPDTTNFDTGSVFFPNTGSLDSRTAGWRQNYLFTATQNGSHTIRIIIVGTPSVRFPIQMGLGTIARHIRYL